MLVGTLLGGAGVAQGSGWTEIPRPPMAHHASALEAGRQWLYAAWCIPTGTTVALFRTPLSSPGTWERLGLPSRPIHDILVMGAADDTVFVAANHDTCVYRSYDGGLHWQAGDVGLPVESAHALAWNGAVPGRLILAGRDYPPNSSEQGYTSDDLGTSWTPAGAHYAINYKPFLAAPPDGSPIFYRTVYDGSWTSSIDRSLDGGVSWQPLTPAASTFSHDLDVHPAAPGCVSALMGGDAVVRWCESEPLDDWPAPWTAVGLALPDWSPSRAFLAGLDAQGRPVAAFREWEGGDWQDCSDGLPSTGGQGVMNQWLSFHLAAASGSPGLFFATLDHGIWMRDAAELAGSDGEAAGPPRAGVLAILPNPSRDAVTLLHAGEAPLRIFDASGRLVRTLDPSAGEVRWDGADDRGRPLPAGIYRARPAAGGPAASIIRLR